MGCAELVDAVLSGAPVGQAAVRSRGLAGVLAATPVLARALCVGVGGGVGAGAGSGSTSEVVVELLAGRPALCSLLANDLQLAGGLATSSAALLAALPGRPELVRGGREGGARGAVRYIVTAWGSPWRTHTHACMASVCHAPTCLRLLCLMLHCTHTMILCAHPSPHPLKGGVATAAGVGSWRCGVWH